MKFVYGVQGPADKVVGISFPPESPVVRLAYDRPIAAAQPGEALIFAPGTSWGSGRNALTAVIHSLHPDADYVILLDHDVNFVRGSFADFEAALQRTRPAVGFPLMPKAKGSATFLPHLDVQRAMALDEQIVALHRSVLGVAGLSPLTTTYDWASWYVSSYIFEYTCSLIYAGAVHQYNTIESLNNDHAWQSGVNTAYMRGKPSIYIPIVEDVLRSMYGKFEASLIEQLDTGFDERRTLERQGRAALIIDIDGNLIRPLRGDI